MWTKYKEWTQNLKLEDQRGMEGVALNFNVGFCLGTAAIQDGSNVNRGTSYMLRTMGKSKVVLPLSSWERNLKISLIIFLTMFFYFLVFKIRQDNGNSLDVFQPLRYQTWAQF
jgi:hypothetical protein